MSKRFTSLFIAFFIASILIPFSFASFEGTPPLTSNDIDSTSESEIIPYADVIVYKYRIYNGILQYRRWNETRGYWVDPYWIDIPE